MENRETVQAAVAEIERIAPTRMTVSCGDSRIMESGVADVRVIGEFDYVEEGS